MELSSFNIAYTALLSGFIIWLYIYFKRKFNRLLVSEKSKLKAAETELVESKAQLQSIVDNLPGMFFRLSTDDKFSLQYISGNSEEYLGITSSEIEKNNLKGKDVLSEEFILKSREYLGGLVGSNSSGDMTMPIRYKEVSKFVNARFKPTILSNGEKVIDGLLFDVTEQVKTQEQKVIVENNLRKSQKRLQALMENLPGMVYRSAYKNDYRLSFVSNGALGLTGYSKEQLLRKSSIYSIIKDSYKERIQTELKEALSNNNSYNLFYEIQTPSGAKWVYDRGQEIEPGYLEGIIIDITDRIEAEEKIIQAIIQTEDRERKRIAKELHDSLGQKLTSVSLYFNSLKGVELSEKDRSERVSTGLGHLDQAIKETRDIAHNLMPKGVEDFGFRVSIENLINEVNAAGEVNFEFYHNLKFKDLSVTLGMHLYRITQEAINNIMKYAEAKNVSIQLMIYHDLISWTIEDDGKGFDVDSLDKESQFGLESMRHRTKLMSGNFNIDSHIGKGTNISIEIPFKGHYLIEES